MAASMSHSLAAGRHSNLPIVTPGREPTDHYYQVRLFVMLFVIIRLVCGQII
jgi:hypothetical protein